MSELNKPEARWPAISTPLWAGGLLFGAILAASLLALFKTPYEFDAIGIAGRMEPPSYAHWLGADEFGRDVLSRMLRGGATSIGLGLAATIFSFVIGVPLGFFGGYVRGWRDNVLMRGVDIMISIPPVMLGLLILAMTTPSPWKASLAVGIIYVPIVLRLARSLSLSLAQEEFMLAARIRGEGLTWILFREILPNAAPTLIVEFSLRVGFAILFAAVFSFLGLGTQPPSSDWGLMISEARPYLEQAPWVALAPGIMICVTVFSINLLGEGLRRTFDKKQLTGA
jgi:peptide/nickel transport system permease protein